MYHFTEQLRVTRGISRLQENSELLKNTRLIILEHILPTTEAFLKTLQEVGCEIFAVITKPYSIDEKVFDSLIESNFNIIRINSYDEIENTNILDNLLVEANKKSEEDSKSIAIIDVGGYFAKPLSNLTFENKCHIIGVIEDTTFGHNRYKSKINEIKFPIASVARSELKEIEARFVGRDAVQAMDIVLRKLGISITGRNALVIGYGMIGKNVARTLQGYDLNVYVYDIEDKQLLKAFIDGFHIHKKTMLQHLYY